MVNFQSAATFLVPDGKSRHEPEEKTSMFTDTALRNIKPKSTTYKAFYRDGCT
jgi:hypothetical protein